MTTNQTNTEITRKITVRIIFRFLLGGFLLLAGIGHLTWAREEFTAQVPQWIPLNDDLVVVLSGVTEMMMGAALLFLPKYRSLIGWIVAFFFVIVFPGNISQLATHTDAFGLNSDTSRTVRLFFQPILVIWALWSTEAWSEWRKKRKKNKD